MQISAQISLYPLRQERLSPTIEAALKILENSQLGLDKGGMSTIVTGECDEVFRSLEKVFRNSAERGPVSMVVTFSNACPI
jgi:uncharacterized protein YqgV (UPF0045/DUF77 family)